MVVSLGTNYSKTKHIEKTPGLEWKDLNFHSLNMSSSLVPVNRRVFQYFLSFADQRDIPAVSPAIKSGHLQAASSSSHAVVVSRQRSL